METHYHRFRESLLPILRCVRCQHTELDLRDGRGGLELDGVELLEEHLCCGRCGERYPITQDVIPILWTPGLKQYYLEQRVQQDCVLHANITLYDEVASSYKAYIRTHRHIGEQVHNAAAGVIETSDGGSGQNSPPLHLDFGCGSGQVLGWLADLGLRQVGLDTSLNNLRIAQSHTGAMVVCGDASDMPFIHGCFDLVTESSMLHHVEDWHTALKEACRVCSDTGGIILDCEPSDHQMAYGLLSRAVLAARLPIYRVVGPVWKKRVFSRNRQIARLTKLAEIHHQPGTGISMEEVCELLQQAGYAPEIAPSWTSWKTALLALLSFRNPWNAKYVPFTTIARRAA